MAIGAERFERWRRLNKLYPFEDIQLGDMIGAGNFGDVYHGILTRQGAETRVAIKTVPEKKNLPEFLLEGEKMIPLSHPHVLEMVGFTFLHDGSPRIILPFMRNGDLRSHLIEASYSEVHYLTFGST